MVNASQGDSNSNNQIEHLYELLEQLHKRPNEESSEDSHTQSSDVPAIFNELRSFLDYGNSRFIEKLGEDIKTRERIIRDINEFSLDIRLRLEDHLRQEIDSKKSYLRFLPSSGSSLLLVLLFIWIAESGISRLDVPNALMVALLCSIIIIFPLRVLIVLQIQRLETMVYCLECAEK